jgi:hypothetical protein
MLETKCSYQRIKAELRCLKVLSSNDILRQGSNSSEVMIATSL